MNEQPNITTSAMVSPSEKRINGGTFYMGVRHINGSWLGDGELFSDPKRAEFRAQQFSFGMAYQVVPVTVPPLTVKWGPGNVQTFTPEVAK